MGWGGAMCGWLVVDGRRTGGWVGRSGVGGVVVGVVGGGGGGGGGCGGVCGCLLITSTCRRIVVR